MARPEIDALLAGKTLAQQIIIHMKWLGITDIVFDFDGTLLKTHSYFAKGYKGLESNLRPEDKDPEILMRDWFADFNLLREIGIEGKSDPEFPINFHIVSNQDPNLINEILTTVGIREMFDPTIHGKGVGDKRPIVEGIAAGAVGRVFYIDDDNKEISAFTDYEGDKVICVAEGILKRYNERAKSAAPQDCGLTVEKWGMIRDQLVALESAATREAAEIMIQGFAMRRDDSAPRGFSRGGGEMEDIDMHVAAASGVRSATAETLPRGSAMDLDGDTAMPGGSAASPFLQSLSSKLFGGFDKSRK